MFIIEHFLYSPSLFQLTFIIFFLSFIAYIIAYVYYIKYNKGSLKKPSESKKNLLSYIAFGSFTVAMTLNIILIVDTWITAGRPPFRTMYETLIYYTFTFSIAYFFLEIFSKIRIFGIFVTIIIIGIFLYALGKRDVEQSVLMPALQTPIMVPHVTSYFIAYALIGLSFISALLSLIIKKDIDGFWLMSSHMKVNIHKLTYGLSKIAFLFLTFGLLLGSWWGQVAWSNYWGFDPKENWAFVSWLIFTSYFHLRFVKGWGVNKQAWVVIVGASAILFTYLGMQYLPKEIHQDVINNTNKSLHTYTDE